MRTSDEIATIQNEASQLARLAAQRVLYSRAKRVFICGTIISVAVPMLFIALTMAFATIKPWAALYGLLATVIDLAFMDGWQKRLQRTAADVQEQFDCEVLGIPLSPLQAGGLVDPEAVQEAAARFERGDPGFSTLRNWYPMPDVRLPAELACVICQRTNLRWDGELRKRFAVGLVVFILLASVSALAVALGARMSVEELVLRVLAPGLPAITWASREAKRQFEAASDAAKLKAQVERLWTAQRSGGSENLPTPAQIRAVQDQIYDRRRRAPLVFDWVYALLRRRFERQANLGVVALGRTASSGQAER